MLSSNRPDGMGDHIMEGPGNCVELSYNIILMVPPGGGKCRRPEKRLSIG